MLDPRYGTANPTTAAAPNQPSCVLQDSGWALRCAWPERPCGTCRRLASMPATYVWRIPPPSATVRGALLETTGRVRSVADAVAEPLPGHLRAPFRGVRPRPPASGRRGGEKGGRRRSCTH